MEKLRVNLSGYHQQCLEAAMYHLLKPNYLTPTPEVFSDVNLKKIWGTLPIFMSTYRHALIDPVSGPPQADILSSLVVQNISTKVSQNHLVWESHPYGLGQLKLEVGSVSIAVCDNIPNTTQWGIPHPATRESLKSLPNPLTWQKSALFLADQLKQKDLPTSKIEQILENIRGLRSILDENIRVLLDNFSLTRFTLRWERDLLDRLGLNYFGNLSIQPASDSTVNKQVNQTLKLVEQKIGLIKMFDRMFDEGQGSLFAGGTEDYLMRVGFSKKNQRLELLNHDPLTGKKQGKPKEISMPDLFDLLDQTEIMATGRVLAATLVLGSTQTPIVYLGNGSREFALAKKSFNFQHTEGLRQMTEDWKDCWPIIQVKSQDQVYTPGLASLYLWFNNDASSNNPVVSQFQKLALSQGEPIILEEKEYLSL